MFSNVNLRIAPVYTSPNICLYPQFQISRTNPDSWYCENGGAGSTSKGGLITCDTAEQMLWDN